MGLSSQKAEVLGQRGRQDRQVDLHMGTGHAAGVAGEVAMAGRQPHVRALEAADSAGAVRDGSVWQGGGSLWHGGLVLGMEPMLGACRASVQQKIYIFCYRFFR
jgi:hypothetical protein